MNDDFDLTFEPARHQNATLASLTAALADALADLLAPIPPPDTPDDDEDTWPAPAYLRFTIDDLAGRPSARIIGASPDLLQQPGPTQIGAEHPTIVTDPTTQTPNPADILRHLADARARERLANTMDDA